MQIIKPYLSKTNFYLFISLFIFLIIWSGTHISWKIGIEKMQTNTQQQLEQFISHLDARISRFKFVPQLISKNMILVDLLKDPRSSPRIDLVNHFLEDINHIIGASDTYLMNADGLTLAASNWIEEQTFINKNFSFRPYFIEAMKGKLGHYFALGSTSGKRGYYFAYPITYASKTLGVIVVKMDLSNIELNWSNRNIQFIVSDPDGIVFITTKKNWLYQGVKPLSNETIKKIKLSQRYNGIDIKVMQTKVLDSIAENTQTIKIINNTKKETIDYLTIKKNVPHAGWDVMILSPLIDLRKKQLITIIVISLFIILSLLIGFLIWQRLKRQQVKEHFQREAQKQLEQQVALRTTDLTREIDEHKQTEQMLRETQDELIQTAKLAVLGQMSASISHELNNPLAAIHSYTDNARKFLSLDKLIQVDENLCRIIQLTKRMSKISSQLKFFARKSNHNIERVIVQRVVSSAIDIVNHKYKNCASIIKIHNDTKELQVNTDIIQLEQILINLINNAMQATEKKENAEVIICIEKQSHQAFIHIDDNGSGIEQKNIEKIFDPFFTTKKSGLGLGLSISARIMDIMNGKLSVCNLPSGGARFTISLLLAEKKNEA